MTFTNKQLNAINSSPALKELKPWLMAMDAENKPVEIRKYYFISYGESAGTTELGRGTVKTTGVSDNDYSQVVVLTNEPNEEFVGEKYWVVSNALPSGTDLYQLYTGAGTGATGMYVKISVTEFSD